MSSTGRDDDEEGSIASDDTPATSNIQQRELEDQSLEDEPQPLQPYGSAQQTHVEDDDRSDLPDEDIAAERRRQRNARKRARQKARKKGGASLGEESASSGGTTASDLSSLPEDEHQLSLVSHDRQSRQVDDDVGNMEESFATADPDARALVPAGMPALDESQAVVPYYTSGETALVPADAGAMGPAGGLSGEMIPVEGSQQMVPVTGSQQMVTADGQQGMVPVSEQHHIVTGAGGQDLVHVTSQEHMAPLGDQHRVVPAGAVQNLGPVEGALALVPVGGEQSIVPVGGEQALVPVTGDQQASLPDQEQRLVPTRNQRAVARAGRRVVPVDADAPTETRALAFPIEDRALALVDAHESVEAENQLALRESAHSSTSLVSKGTTGWEKYDERTISSLKSDKELVPIPARQEHDEISLTTEDVFSKYSNVPSKVGEGEELVGDSRTTDESGSGKSGWKKPGYQDEISTDVEEEEEQFDDIDDESTINTYGSNYWTSRYPNKPSLHPPQEEEEPAPIQEEEEDEELGGESQQNSSGYSGVFKKGSEAPPDEESYHNDSWRSGRSLTESSVRSAGSRSRGIVLRPLTARASRRDTSREVEVSLDGFMHQPKPVHHERPGVLGDMSSQPFVVNMGDDNIGKLSRVYRYCTLCAILCLVATIMFFAVHIGPFVVQPEAQRKATGNTRGDTQSAQSAEVIPGTTTSTGFLADGPITPEDEAAAVTLGSTPTNEAGEIIGVPLWATRAFVNWRRQYLGASSEVPFIWNLEKSGGDIVAESFTLCLGKVVAGDGRRYGPQGQNAAFFDDNDFKVLSSPLGHQYLDVDLFTPEGVDKAGAMGVTSKLVSEFLYTPMLRYGAERLFVPRTGKVMPEVAGRLLVVFRDPVDRALNRYDATRLLSGNDQLTLTDFALSPIYSENNPLTRGLLGLAPSEGIEIEQVRVAQQIIDRHVLVGLFDKLDESIMRYEQFLHWYVGGSNAQVAQCHKNVRSSFDGGYRVNNNDDAVGTNLIRASYSMDKLVYDYAKALFEVQGRALTQMHHDASTK